MHFLDSSAIVKLYADEEHCGEVRDLASPVFVSALARVEVPAAMWRKHRTGELDAEMAGALDRQFGRDWARPGADAAFLAIAVTADLLVDAAQLCSHHGLKACDAVQLASAVAVRAVVPECMAFTGFDVALNRAAATMRFTTRPTT